MYQRIDDGDHSYVADSIQQLSKINLDLERGIRKIGTRKDTKQFRSSLHDLLLRGSSTAQRISSDLRFYEGVKKTRLVQLFRREALQIQTLGKELSTKERNVIARLSVVDEDFNQSFKELGIPQQSHQEQVQDQVVVDVSRLEADVSELEDREQGLRNILGEVGQLNDMMQDLAELVDEQQELVDNIEDNISSTQQNTHLGEKEIVSASSYQKRARSWLCYLFALFVAILIVVGIVLYVHMKK